MLLSVKISCGTLGHGNNESDSEKASTAELRILLLFLFFMCVRAWVGL